MAGFDPNFYSSPANPWGSSPGSIDPEFRVLTTTGAINAIYQTDVVKVSMVAGAYNTVLVTWPAVTGAISYVVRRGFSLFYSQAVVEATVTPNTCTFQFNPTVPPDSVMNVWVTAQFTAPAPAALVQATPASVESFADYFARANKPLEVGYADYSADNDYMRFVAAEVRRRTITMMQNDGEWFTVYARRWSGTRCKCNEEQGNLQNGPDAIQGNLVDSAKGIGTEPDTSADPQYDALARCPKCWGTGIIGGYYYGTTTLMRYGNLPARQILFKNFSVDLPHNFNTWTVWEPKLHEHDLARRLKTGEYFEIEKCGRGEWRAVPFHQESNMVLLPPGDSRYTITDAAIVAAGG